MLKRILILLLVVCCLASGCGKKERNDRFGKEESSQAVNEEQSKQKLEKDESSKTENKKEENKEVITASKQALLDFQELILGAEDLFAIAYLGYYEGEYTDTPTYLSDKGFIEEFPFLEEITEEHAVFAPGYSMFALIPASEDVSIQIHSLEFGDENNDYALTKADELFESKDGQLILLRCNESDEIPNVMITAIKEGETLEYYPGLSMMDGSVLTTEGMYDFTSYALIESLYGELGVVDPYLCGTWYGRWWDGEGEQLALELTLNEDGTAIFLYGRPYSEIWEWYEGTWSSDEIYLYLDLYGGPVDVIEGQTEMHEIQSSYTWYMSDFALDLYLSNGTPLMTNGDTEYPLFSFLPFDGWQYVGYWTTPVNESGWYYDLWLGSNGMCYFDYFTEEGELLVSYEGYWGTSDGYMDLYMWRIEGENPDNPELEVISGYYLASAWNDGSMVLEYMSGDILTLQMEETQYAEFSNH